MLAVSKETRKRSVSSLLVVATSRATGDAANFPQQLYRIAVSVYEVDLTEIQFPDARLDL
jgi:hypothetical protein